MAYATQADIPQSEQDLIGLTDDAGTGAVDASVVSGQIRRADRLIDAYLRSRYTVPFDPPPPEIVELSGQLAWYYLERRRMSTPTDGARDAYKDALQFLKDLQAGRATLSEEGQDEEIAKTPGRVVTNKTASSRTFPKSVLDKF